MDLRKHLEVMPAAERRRSGRPLAHAVHGQHQGLLERRGIESGCGVAQMVFAEQELLLPVEALAEVTKLVAQKRFLKQLLAQP
jgi:hypothetical protein